MQAGNAFYMTARDIPRRLPVLTMKSDFLLPGGFLSITLSQPHYIQMVEDAMQSHRLIAMVLAKTEDGSLLKQNKNRPLVFDTESILSIYQAANDNMMTWKIGSVGRITSYSEVGSGQLLITLQGVCRFHLKNAACISKPYHQYSVQPFAEDLKSHDENAPIAREEFVKVFNRYLTLNHLAIDWEIVADAPNESLVNTLSTIAPFAPAEKQAILEAPNLQMRADTMIAIAERAMLLSDDVESKMIQ